MWNKLNKSMMFSQAMFGLSYYGVMILLTPFFIEKLDYSEAETMMIVGAFSSIGPLFAIAGGFIKDKFLGSYRTLTIAYGAFVIGYILLVIGASTSNIPMSLIGIALPSYARGLMSPSYPCLYKCTFATKEDFENVYPVNYSINNVGALIGQYIFPMLVLVIGFYGSFILSTIMATLALISLVIFRKQFIVISTDTDYKQMSMKNWIYFLAISIAMIGVVFFMFSNMDIGKNLVYIISAIAIVYFISLMFKHGKSDSIKMGTILIMTVLLTTCFFVYYGQMMTSMTMVGINTMRGDLFNIIPIAPEASPAMNPLWCMVAGPIIAFTFSTLEKKGIFFSTATKIAFAFALTAIAFGILTFAVMNVGEDTVIRPEVFLAVHFFQAFAEVIVGSLVVAFILSVAPKQIEGFSVSLFYIAIALSGIIGAVLSTYIALDKGQEISQEFVQTTYGNYFQLLTVLAVIMVAVALISSVVIRKMLEAANAHQHASE